MGVIMESKLLQAANDMHDWLLEKTPIDMNIPDAIWNGLKCAIREAEAVHVCIYPADGAPCTVCHKTVAESAHAAPVAPKPDPWACRFGEGERCQDMACPVRDSANIELCPRPSTRQDAPPRRTKLDVAREAFNSLEVVHSDAPLIAVLKVLGINPDEVDDGKGEG